MSKDILKATHTVGGEEVYELHLIECSEELEHPYAGLMKNPETGYMKIRTWTREGHFINEDIPCSFDLDLPDLS